jgi:hypothetical protein
MPKPTEPASLPIPPLPRTRKDAQGQKKRGLITGWMNSNISKGRPPKTAEPEKAPKEGGGGQDVQVPKSRGSYTNWDDPENAAHLRAAALAAVHEKGVSINDVLERFNLTEIHGKPQISRQQIDRKILELKKDEQSNNSIITKKKPNGLISDDEVKFLEEAIVKRDLANNGMDRKEVITYIQNLTGCDFKTAENHFHHLQRSNKFPRLKRGGRVVVAQKTTTKRSQIRTESQLRWHSIIESVWGEVKRYNNSNYDVMSDKKPFTAIMPYFWLNFDETCIVASDGNVSVLSGKETKTTSRIMSDSRLSITILRVGSAAGCDGPLIFLVEGKSVHYKALKDIVQTFGCPPGSCVIPTPSAYMTDDAWEEVLPHLIEGIRQMPVIRDYPEFKCMVTFDG